MPASHGASMLCLTDGGLQGLRMRRPGVSWSQTHLRPPKGITCDHQRRIAGLRRLCTGLARTGYQTWHHPRKFRYTSAPRPQTTQTKHRHAAGRSLNLQTNLPQSHMGSEARPFRGTMQGPFALKQRQGKPFTLAPKINTCATCLDLEERRLKGSQLCCMFIWNSFESTEGMNKLVGGVAAPLQVLRFKSAGPLQEATMAIDTHCGYRFILYCMQECYNVGSW